MGKYRLSPQARNQIRDIGRFSSGVLAPIKRKPTTLASNARLNSLQTSPKWVSQPTNC